MSVFMVDKYVVKPEKQGEFMQLMLRFLNYKKENPEKFKGAKSWKLFVQMFGGITHAYIEMWEFDNMADAEKCFANMQKDERFTKMVQEFTLLIDPATRTTNLWSTVM